jgi:hypothetical protein
MKSLLISGLLLLSAKTAFAGECKQIGKECKKEVRNSRELSSREKRQANQICNALKQLCKETKKVSKDLDDLFGDFK